MDDIAFQEPLLYQNVLEIPTQKVQRLQDALNLVEPIIQEGGWLVPGSKPTVADICCAVYVATNVVSSINLSGSIY